MFNPTKTHRRWHRKCNVQQRRLAMCSALAASALPSLVMAKGHKIEQIPEVPLIVDDKVQEFKKTKEAVGLLKKLKVWDDIKKVMKSKRLRAGKGKLRNRRRIMRRGPCVIYSQNDGIVRAFRNIPGISLMNVSKLNLLTVAPGGHVGRFLIWTESAVKELDKLYGTWRKASQLKTNFNLPMPKMMCTDLTKIMKSDELRAVLRPTKSKPKRRTQKKNPLKNIRVMLRLNPAAVSFKRAALLTEAANVKSKAAAKEKKAAGGGKKKTAAKKAVTKKGKK